MTFEHWWSNRFEWKFGIRWLEPIAKQFAAAGWNAALGEYGNLRRRTTTHKTILVFWKDSQGEHVFQLRNVTEAVARERAEFFGYVKPKWWQFWKDELHLIFD